MKTHPTPPSIRPRRSPLAVLAAASLLTGQVAQAASTVEILTTSDPVAEDAVTAIVVARRVNDLETAVSVRYRTTDGTATEGEDYSAVTGLLEFAVGETERTITIPLINDGQVEERLETFDVILSEPSEGAVLGARSQARVTIVDNDTGFRIEYAAYQAQENEGGVLVAILRGTDADTMCSVDYSTADATATAGVDYTAASGTLTFSPEEEIRFLTIPILNDAVRDPQETFTLTLGNPSAGAAISPQDATATLTIMDNDTGAHWQLPDPWSGGYWAAEGEGAVNLVVYRGQDIDLPPCTIDYTTADVTATGGLDYVPSSGTIAFAEGELTQTVTVQILGDDEAEATEQFRLELSNPSPGMIFLPRESRVTVNILDATGHSGHIVDSVAFQPASGCTLGLTSSLSAQYSEAFDVFWIDASDDLDAWERVGFAAKRNGSPDSVSYFDEDARAHAKRFYRIPTPSCIVPFPPPTGPYAVGFTERILTDSTRRNRYSRSSDCSFRVWVYYPAVATAGSEPRLHFPHVSRLRLYHSYGSVNAPVALEGAPFPIVLYSHGLGSTVGAFTDRAEELASHGYVVISVDHFDAPMTTLSDGEWLTWGDFEIDQATTDDRIRDLQFILDQSVAWHGSDPLLSGCLDLESVAVTGFSWGGETAAETCRRDTRVDVAVLLDPGGVITAAHSLGVGKPFVQISTGDLNLFSLAKQDAIWFQISGTVHTSFDGYYWYWSLDAPATSRADEQCNLTVRAYMLSFLDKYLKGKGTTLHEGPSPEHPRVVNYMRK